MAARNTIAVRILGQEYRIRSDGDDEAVESAAALVDETMRALRARSAAVDSLDVAVLTALNLARRLVTGGAKSARAANATGGGWAVEPERVRALLALVQGAQAAETRASRSG